MKDPELTDEEIRSALYSIDRDLEKELNPLEFGFLETVVYELEGPLTERQREFALKILEKYE